LWFEGCDMRRRFGASPWISAIAHLHIGTGTDLCLCRFPVCRLPTDPRFPSRRSRACQTCSISTPSSFWRWRCSFSSACEACWVSARVANGRLTTLIPPPTRGAVRPMTMWWRCPARGGGLPGGGGETAKKPVEPPEPAERWKGIAEAGSTVAAGLDAVAREDKTFDAKHFVAGARAAYEMIVLAYAEGDRRTLKNLLSR